jgi:hypothetical protein
MVDLGIDKSEIFTSEHTLEILKFFDGVNFSFQGKRQVNQSEDHSARFL